MPSAPTQKNTPGAPKLYQGFLGARGAVKKDSSIIQSSSVRKPYIEVQGGRFSFHRPCGSAGRKGGGIRGTVREFSRGSRRRLMSRFASLDWRFLISQQRPILFLTLTTPSEYWTEDLRVYVALKAFRTALCARYEGVSVIWRKERGSKSGALHYHLVVFGVKRIPASWLRAVWTEKLGYCRPVRVHIERPEKPEKVARYVSKYCSKAAYQGADTAYGGEPPGGTRKPLARLSLSKAHNGEIASYNGFTGGRFWGVWGVKSLPVGTVDEIDQEIFSSASRCRRLFRRLLRSRILASFKRKHPAFVNRPDFDRLFKRYLRELPKMRFLKTGGGFTVFCDPDIIDRVLDSAFSAQIWISEGNLPPF